jgi:VanZ family protein
MHKTSAWPLALTYAALIVYASLYPFADWRLQGIAPWAFLTAPWPRYWTGFDVVSNVLGYGPLGFLLALTVLRTRNRLPAVLLAAGAAGGLSLMLESLQGYLPARVASNVDLALNVLGAWLGAVLAWILERLGALDRWSRFRARWFVPEARGALVLLALWPLALLFPAPVPFGLGQVLERLEETLADWLADTPFLEWIPLREVELQPLLPGAELLAVMLGALIPCLLGYSVIRSQGRRAVFGLTAVALGLGASALSAALSYGPAHAWAWLSPPVRLGLGASLVGALLLLALPRRACAALVLLALVWHLGLLNNAPTGAYFAQTLQTWEQGRFIRFHGLAQWLGWLWPYLALAYVLLRVSSLEVHADRRHPGEN